MQRFTTPMMKQYQEIKREYKDCLLFFRLGDFYELFMEDAHIGARVLDITLTSRAKGKDGRIPMAGVPYHAVDSYLAKLVKAGYKVAICEQISEPNKYGIVDREVVRVVTPGTVLDEKALEKKDNNYIISLQLDAEIMAISAADISTGYFQIHELSTDNLEDGLKNELSRLSPVECILPEELYNNPEILKLLTFHKKLNIYCFNNWSTYAQNAQQFLKDHFQVATLASFNLEDKPLILETAAALLGYLQETQKQKLSHIKKITRRTSNEYVLLDRTSMMNLELFSTIREGETTGSLLAVLDETITAMGGRLLKHWLKHPLTKKEAIESRLYAVEEFLKDRELRQSVRQELEEVGDIERKLARLSVGIGNARDLVNLKESLKHVLSLKDQLQKAHASLIKQIVGEMKSQIGEIINLIDTTLVDEPPIDVKVGRMIKSGVDTELDKLRTIIGGSRSWIEELERTERERTSIGSLKVRFNKVFGFYIEISKPNLHLVPPEYIRKQTLVNSERFITEELKQHEEIILSAEEKIQLLEYHLFLKILRQVLSHIELLQLTAQATAELDCLANFGEIAEKNNYMRPKLLYSGEIRIKSGRHPVVEKLLAEGNFVPNDLVLDTIRKPLLLITGPNMAGKSVLIRQVALIVLMAHIGSFVPAEQAHISLVDRIFVRSGASDAITAGLSTFMVEMVETAHILHHMTKNSLIVMDEIGRGTSTYDGISIAWAVAEYLITHIKTPPKTLFATHYHELQALEKAYPHKIKNYHMAVIEENGEPVFLYTLLPGGASHSFGVAVAKMAGVPAAVTTKAFTMLAALEKRHQPNGEIAKRKSKTEGEFTRLRHELEKLDIYKMTPLEALNKLAELKNKLNVLI